MAYPTIDAPYGYKPVNLIGGQVFTGSTRMYPIAYNYAVSLFTGDPVTLNAGYTVIATLPVSTTNTVVGVFAGCSYTDPATKQKRFSQYYPANTLAGDIVAYVVDDPTAIFRCAVTAAANSLVIASAPSLIVGQNLAGNSGATVVGNVNTGNSVNGVVTANTNQAAAGFRVVGLVPDTQILTSCTYVSGTGTANIVVSGLALGQFIPLGTDMFVLNANGQLSYTGTAVGTPATVSSTTAQTLAMSGNTTASGTLVLVQSPEVLVKLNFGAHRYFVA
jgi:hypothetical protein